MRTASKKLAPFDAKAFLNEPGLGTTVVELPPSAVVFSQGDPCDSIFYIQRGSVKLSVVSNAGREAVVGVFGPGDFFGEGALAAQPLRLATATSLAPSRFLAIPKKHMIRLLHEQRALSDRFIAHMLARNRRLEEDLVDQLFNASEKRLARMLLLLAGYGKREGPRRAAEDFTGGAGGNGRNDALARELLHEQVQKARVHRIQRPAEDPRLAFERRAQRSVAAPPLIEASSHVR